MKKIFEVLGIIVLCVCCCACSNKEIVDDAFTCSVGDWTTVEGKDALTTSLTFNTNDLSYETFSSITFVLFGDNDSVVARAVSDKQKIINLLEYYEDNWPLTIGNLTIVCKFVNTTDYTNNDMWKITPFEYDSNSTKKVKKLKVIIETADKLYMSEYEQNE